MPMHVSKQRMIAIIVVIIAIIGGTVYWYQTRPEPERVVPEDALDVTLDFYNGWVAVRKDNTRDRVQGLTDISKNIAPELTNRLQGAVSTLGEGQQDPILCTTYLPDRVGGKVIFEATTTAEILVVPRGVETPLATPAIVTLNKDGELWRITNIACSSGETAPESEFSFMISGRLLKNVPPPLNPEFWHVVYEQNGVGGYTAPLYFASSSQCSFNNEAPVTCDTSRLYETANVRVEGNMTEAGVDVVRLTELIPS